MASIGEIKDALELIDQAQTGCHSLSTRIEEMRPTLTERISKEDLKKFSALLEEICKHTAKISGELIALRKATLNQEGEDESWLS